MSFRPRSVVLLVSDLLHPVDCLAVELFLNSDVGHRSARHGAMPVLLAGRALDDVARSNDLDRAAPTLHAPTARRNNQRLAKGVGVPVASRARLECHVCAACARGRRRLEKLVDAYRTGEIFRGPVRRRLRTVSLQIHDYFSFRRFSKTSLAIGNAEKTFG